MTEDEKYMMRCIQLAQNGALHTAPNPMVGAVIVADHRIIGEGYHAICGQGHAEVNAFAAVRDEARLKDATLYVSLEPCSHYGKTPPCAELIIRKGVRRVVVGCTDPFEKVAGRGIAMLRDAGIDVQVGVMEKECRALIRRFTTLHLYHRPYITLKWAQSADGFVDVVRDSGEAVRLSTPLSSVYVHRQRALHQAIMVGRRTALLDDPSLSVRDWSGRQPLRVVMDREGVLPDTLRLFDGHQPTLVFTAKSVERVRSGVEWCNVDFARPVIPQILSVLAERQIQSLLVEGGPHLLRSFIDCGLWDEAFVECSEVVLGEGVAAPMMPVGHRLEMERRDKHTILHYSKKD